MASEETLIERVRRRFPSARGGGRVGIGDDAAVLAPAGKTDLVVSTDQFLENIHFLRKTHPPRVVGYKALARATSDIAAMGARPSCFFLSLGLPSDCAGKWFDAFLDGMAGAARRFGLTLVGGDTTKYAKIVINLTVLGEVHRGRAVLRSGARPGDLLCISGTLGQAELGLQLILKKLPVKKGRARLLRKHLHPEPRLALGQWLAAREYATAMIDTSDGLSTDLDHICKASGVGAMVWTVKIPAVQVPPEFGSRGMNALQLALHGGEDYELLFTAPKKIAPRLPAQDAGVSITVIGEVTRGNDIVLVDADGRRVPLKPAGWDPFR
jgi:thiamine-monophosphate kinase